MKPTKSPTQGQPNPRKNTGRLKVAFGSLFFSTANIFSLVGIVFMWETDYKKPNPNQILRQHPSNSNSKYTHTNNKTMRVHVCMAGMHVAVHSMACMLYAPNIAVRR